MQLSGTLSRYIARQFLLWFATVFLTLVAIVTLFDLLELLRRAAARPNVTLGIVLQMTVLKQPLMAQKLLPFAMLFSGMFTFWRLTRSNELIVARAAGISVWQFLFPALAVAAVVGVLNFAVLSPFSSIVTERFDQLEARYLQGKSSLLSVSAGGVWLRQAEAGDQSVIHAARIQADTMELTQAIVFLYQGNDRFIGRIDAASATLEDGAWVLSKAWISGVDEGPARFEETYWLPTDLTRGKILDSFAAPETLSFWQLPAFIRSLELAGFSALRHRLQWHSLLASPVLLCAMLLLAAGFSLRHTRRGGTLFQLSVGVGTAFLLYFVSDVVIALGFSANLPVILAAWAPTAITLMASVGLLLHLEDG